MYKPKDTKDIYFDALAVNASNFKKQLAAEDVQPEEVKVIVKSVVKSYDEHVGVIVEECKRDMMALENVPSPLKLFIECLAEAKESLNLSWPARLLIEKYISAWEDWM